MPDLTIVIRLPCGGSCHVSEISERSSPSSWITGGVTPGARRYAALVERTVEILAAGPMPEHGLGLCVEVCDAGEIGARQLGLSVTRRTGWRTTAAGLRLDGFSHSWIEVRRGIVLEGVGRLSDPKGILVLCTTEADQGATYRWR
jgi:hypothetical protein